MYVEHMLQRARAQAKARCLGLHVCGCMALQHTCTHARAHIACECVTPTQLFNLSACTKFYPNLDCR